MSDRLNAKLNATHMKTEEIKPNKALHQTAIPLRSIAAGDFFVSSGSAILVNCMANKCGLLCCGDPRHLLGLCPLL